MKGQKRKVMSVSVALLQQHIPHKSERVAVETEGVSYPLILFYYLLSPEQGAHWLTGLPGGIAGADGANGIRILGVSSLSCDGWVTGPDGSLELKARLTVTLG